MSVEGKKATRRRFLLTAAGVIGGGVVGAALGWGLKPTAVEREERVTTVTVTETKTVAETKTLAPPKKYEGVKITTLVHSGHQAVPWKKYRDIIKDKWGIELEIVETPPEDIYSKALLGIKSTPPEYDIIQWNSAWIGDFEPYILPLDDFIRKPLMDPGWGDILPGYRNFHNTWGGKIYSLTLDGDTFFLYYRKDLFDNPEEKDKFKSEYGYELGPPKTWDQALDIAKFFTRKAGEKLAGSKLTKDFYGIADQLRRGRSYYWYLFRYVPYVAAERNGDPHYFDPETMEPLINSSGAIKALESLGKAKDLAPPGVLGFEWDELFTAAMKEGIIGMWPHWPDEGKRADELAPLPVESPPKPQLGVSMLPGVEKDGKLYRYTIVDAAWVVSVVKGSRNPEAAYTVIAFITGPEASLESVMAPTDFMPDTGLDPYRYSHVNSFRFRQLKPHAIPLLEAYSVALEQGFPLLKIPGAFEYLDTLDLNISKYLAGEIPSAESALNTVASEWNKITEKFGRDKQKEFYKSMWQLLS
jgi:multiple sugar transport system substrate-binding protein